MFRGTILLQEDTVKYEIVGTTMPMVTITLSLGEVVQCQAGAMKWMDSDIDMKTKMQGGLGGLVKRSMMGESGFLNNYEARIDGARIAFGHTFPGKIMPVRVEEVDMICQKRSFLCSELSVELDIAFQKRLGTGFFGGEGFVMQRLRGSGMAFVEIDGEVIEMELAVGQSIKVETGAVAMFQESVNMDIQMVKGIGNMLFGGEGLFLTTLTGPGKVWLQTMSIQSLAREVYPYLPSAKSK